MRISSRTSQILMSNTQRETQSQGSEVAKRKHPHRKDYSEAERQRALIAVAAASGNTRLAARNLAEDGFEIDHTVLWQWQKRHADKYQRIRADLLPRIREQQADAHRALERRQLEVSLQATELIAQRLPQMDDRDAINAAGKMDIGTGIHADKALLHDGQPTSIVQRTSDELLRELEAEGMKLEAIDAEVVSEEDVGPSTESKSVAVTTRPT